MMRQFQKQEQHLYQRQYLGLKVLQMNCADLEAYIREEASCNPLIDLEDEGPVSSAIRVDNSPYEFEYAGMRSSTLPFPDPASLPGSVDPFAETLERHLSEQLYYANLTSEESGILRYLIANLDERGYFRQDPEEAAKRLGVSPQFFQDALSLLQSLDPPGIGAASLEECLSLQLKRIGAPPYTVDIVKDFLPNLAKKQYSVISARLGLPLSLIRDACRLIASLDPKPGNHFDTPSCTYYVIPDVYCTCQDSVIRVCTRFQGREPFSINDYYLSLLKETKDKEVKAYLSERMRRANDLLRSVSDRESTLLSCSKLLVEKQSEYLFGSSERAPFTMTQAAELLGVHISTISRCVQNKYLQGPKGAIPLASLFCQHVPASSPGFSQDHAKKRMLLLIHSEDRNKPLSDQTIADMLGRQGLFLSRRTITKYRQAMGVPSASERKEQSSAAERKGTLSKMIDY